jgi:hypothetical protein
MGEQASHSIPVVWRLHKDLWKKNRQSLEYQMEQARLKLPENEAGRASDQPIELVIGQWVVSIKSE